MDNKLNQNLDSMVALTDKFRDIVTHYQTTLEAMQVVASQVSAITEIVKAAEEVALSRSDIVTYAPGHSGRYTVDWKAMNTLVELLWGKEGE